MTPPKTFKIDDAAVEIYFNSFLQTFNDAKSGLLESDELDTKYKNFLALLQKDTTPSYLNKLFIIISHYLIYSISRKDDLFYQFESTATEFIKSFNKKNKLSSHEEKYNHYFLFIISILNDYKLHNFKITKNAEVLDELLVLRELLEIFIEWNCSVNLKQTAKYLLAKLYFSYTLLPLNQLNAKNSQLNSLLNFSKFENFYKQTTEHIINNLATSELLDLCLLYALQFYHCNLQSYMASLVVFIQEFEKIDLEKFRLFLTKAAENSDQLDSMYLINEIKVGCNLCQDTIKLFSDILVCGEFLADVYIKTSFQDAGNPSWQDPLWNQIFFLFSFKLKIITIRKSFFAFPAVVNKYLSEKAIEIQLKKDVNEAIRINSILMPAWSVKRLQEMQNRLAATAFEVELQSQKSRRKYFHSRKQNELKQEERPKKSKSRRRKKKTTGTAPKTVAQKDEDLINQLIQQKNYEKASSHCLNLLSQKNIDNQQAIFLNMALGDIYRLCELGKKSVEQDSNRPRSEEYYAQCLKHIDIQISIKEETNLLELKSFLEKLIKPVVPATDVASVQKIAIADLIADAEPDLIDPVSENKTAVSIEPEKKDSDNEIKQFPAHILLPEYVNKIIERLLARGHETYLVGGAVRDYLLDSEPHDYDLVTTASMLEITSLFSSEGILVGSRYPVFLLNSELKSIQISPLTSITDKSNPEKIIRKHSYAILYRTTSVREDALKRDFTCNALYYHIKNEQILDPVGGIDDIQQKQLMFIRPHEEAILSDPFLILRAIRVLSRFKFKLSDAAEASMPTHISTLKNQNAARLNYEVTKTLAGMSSPYHFFKKFKILNVLYENANALAFYKLILQNFGSINSYVLLWTGILYQQLINLVSSFDLDTVFVNHPNLFNNIFIKYGVPPTVRESLSAVWLLHLAHYYRRRDLTQLFDPDTHYMTAMFNNLLSTIEWRNKYKSNFAGLFNENKALRMALQKLYETLTWFKDSLTFTYLDKKIIFNLSKNDQNQYYYVSTALILFSENTNGTISYDKNNTIILNFKKEDMLLKVHQFLDKYTANLSMDDEHLCSVILK